jgi:hypothetical protein
VAARPGSTRPSRLQPGGGPGCAWCFPWEAASGAALLKSRAYDERGISQPDTVPWKAKGYLMNAVHEVPVTVK